MSHYTALYLFADNIKGLQWVYCNQCEARPKLLRINRRIASIVKPGGISAQDVPVGIGMVEIKCRTCQVIYQLYFQ